MNRFYIAIFMFIFVSSFSINLFGEKLSDDAISFNKEDCVKALDSVHEKIVKYIELVDKYQKEFLSDIVHKGSGLDKLDTIGYCRLIVDDFEAVRARESCVYSKNVTDMTTNLQYIHSRIKLMGAFRISERKTSFLDIEDVLTSGQLTQEDQIILRGNEIMQRFFLIFKFGFLSDNTTKKLEDSSVNSRGIVAPDIQKVGSSSDAITDSAGLSDSGERLGSDDTMLKDNAVVSGDGVILLISNDTSPEDKLSPEK